MKKKILVISLIIFSVLIGSKFIYHTTMSNEKKAEKITEKFEEKLELSDEQIAKIYEINLQMLKNIHIAKKGNQDKTLKDIRNAMKKDWFVQIKEVLDIEQVKIFEDVFNKKCNKS